MKKIMLTIAAIGIFSLQLSCAPHKITHFGRQLILIPNSPKPLSPDLPIEITLLTGGPENACFAVTNIVKHDGAIVCAQKGEFLQGPIWLGTSFAKVENISERQVILEVMAVRYH